MTVTCHSDTAGAIREALSMPQVAQFYGFEPNRSGFILCPFHHEKTPSLKIYSKGFCCFGCGRKGSVIDFAMELFGLSFQDAIRRLDTDFGLDLTDALPDWETIREHQRKKIRARAQKNAACREYCIKLDELRACNDLVLHAAPDRNDEISDEFAKALKRIPELEYWFETHPVPF